MNDAVHIGKMSLTKLGCIPSEAKESDNPVRLCVIFGQANGLKQGEDKQRGRIWTALKGRFEGVNLKTGGRFTAGLLFLPDGIQDSIESAVSQISAEGNEGMSVKFGLELRSVKSTNPAGYSYQALNVMPMESGDELSPLRQAILDNMKAKNLLNALGAKTIETFAAVAEAPKVPKLEAPKPEAAKVATKK